MVFLGAKVYGNQIPRCSMGQMGWDIYLTPPRPFLQVPFLDPFFGRQIFPSHAKHLGFFFEGSGRVCVEIQSSNKKIHPPKTNMSMENPPFEDILPLENGDFPMSCWFSGV